MLCIAPNLQHLKKKYEEIIDFYFQWEVFESIFKLINLYFIYKF